MKTNPQEPEIIRMIFLLADVQVWLNEIAEQVVGSIQPAAKKLMNGKQYRLSLAGLAHILERHYHGTLRHPGTGKFLMPLNLLLDLLKEAGRVEAIQMSGSINFKREMENDYPIGLNRQGETSWTLVVITDHCGVLLTAFPG